MFILW